MRAPALALVAALALAGPAAAAAARVDVESPDPVVLDGRLAVHAEGVANLERSDGHRTSRFAGATGALSVWTWNVTYVRAEVAGGPVVVRRQFDDAHEARYVLRDADVLVEEAGVYRLRVAALPGGAVGVEGRVDAAGTPVALPSWRETPSVVPSPTRSAPDVDLGWRAGWPFVGDLAGPAEVSGFPSLDGAALAASGPVRLRVEGGVASFTDADGTPHRIDLTHGEASSAAAEVRTVRRMIFEGALAEASVPVEGANWGLAAPSLAWTLDGAVVWKNATGTVHADGRIARFAGATVAGEGAVRIDASPGSVADRPSYRASGEWRSLDVAGAPVAAAPPSPAPPLAAVALLAALLAAFSESVRTAAVRAVAFLFTRIPRGRVLDRPKRRALYETIAAHPGLHLRELQRRTGLGWGAFTYHLARLEQEGFVRVEKEGGFRLAWVATARSDGPLVPHPTARAVFDALPADGRAVELRTIEESLGLSRQLVAHHVRALETRGLAERAPTGDGRPGARRR